MIISRTPFRISFFGGGTDYPSWYREHGGAVLSTTIDKYCYLSTRFLPPFFEHRLRVVYSKIENCHSIDEIEHPSVREVLRFLDLDRGIEIHHDGDLPARSGMGSSSAFTVGLLHALHALNGRMPTRKQLATESIHVEQQMLKENVGSQDQVLAAYGGFNHITFLPNGDFSVRPVTIGLDREQQLSSHLMLFYTGIQRTASNIAATFVDQLDRKKHALRILRDLAEEALSVLTSTRDICQFGELLEESWQVKRGLSEAVSNGRIDELYAAAKGAGAIGGKLLGAGGGGFMLLFVPPELQPRVREALGQLLHVPFKFDRSGTQIIFVDPEQDYSVADRARQEQAVSKRSQAAAS